MTVIRHRCTTCDADNTIPADDIVAITDTTATLIGYRCRHCVHISHQIVDRPILDLLVAAAVPVTWIEGAEA
jgi:hypothetical protein